MLRTSQTNQVLHYMLWDCLLLFPIIVSEPSLTQNLFYYWVKHWIKNIWTLGCTKLSFSYNIYYYALSTKYLRSPKIHMLKSFFLSFNLFMSREREREREREGDKHQYVVASHVPPTRNLAGNLGLCPDRESNQRPFGSQARAPSTEPHQPGLACWNLIN